ncbi:MAG: hypothetical protein FJY54_13270 [Betaproteobacteria bacterium]|nr:hypothetical protein [Betaproteobacteria bacterium]
MSTLPDTISVAKDIIVSVAAIVTASVAAYGINKWRRELSGKAHYDAAHGLLKATYKLRDAIAGARSPLILAGEFPSGYGGAMAKPSNDEEAQAYAYVYRNRWKPIWDALEIYDSAALEAEAVWGDPVKSSTERFRRCLNTLQTSNDFHVDYVRSGGTNLDRDFTKKVRADISASRGSDDPLSQEIRDSIAAIEAQVKPVLKR